ncbi:SMC-Scp complex subunit ScpB [Sphingobacterium spiritivorum]|uniref:Segregation and condensation protein B n=1 Tax=Sphingobacterium spiritivorum ATCC 33861 TaxID=525373 RepID=D7VSN9_SPHSI|nr:SMC-Scp complex subunit ScpB [Sphingobacterium spiritivorum]EFK56790.1 segregation and condensation protein B [Sphingobacterium spiritivorum ATCC 33861]QQT35183.1 SMC-Scp complex subunit ScpB [Sphingobacterium spiritivorum]WQD36089.1 SMC-Scp complex subunit ScpB [Sphingobacterium spiritivorum]SUJ03717.1 Segregation and condensation protein B homolog [Sphingobacterium spiritivorum]
MKDVLLHIEAIIFASEEGITLNELKQVLEDALAISISKDEITDLVDRIKIKYQQEDYILELKLINNAYQFLTKPLYHESVNQLQSHKEKKKLSQSALETLAIIAYRQPITKLEVEQIRGVNCDYSIQRLLEKNLIQITGKSETIGKPLLYGTSTQFMNHFGINSTKDLPQLKDIVNEENTIGEIAE